LVRLGRRMVIERLKTFDCISCSSDSNCTGSQSEWETGLILFTVQSHKPSEPTLEPELKLRQFAPYLCIPALCLPFVPLLTARVRRRRSPHRTLNPSHRFPRGPPLRARPWASPEAPAARARGGGTGKATPPPLPLPGEGETSGGGESGQRGAR
jgi:hypothetical protein